jgi:hypothetical protein
MLIIRVKAQDLSEEGKTELKGCLPPGAYRIDGSYLSFHCHDETQAEATVDVLAQLQALGLAGAVLDVIVREEAGHKREIKLDWRPIENYRRLRKNACAVAAASELGQDAATLLGVGR